MTYEADLEHVEVWLNAVEAMIALLAAQLPAPARDRFATALRELESTGPDINARLSWSASLNRVLSLIRDDDEKSTASGKTLRWPPAPLQCLR